MSILSGRVALVTGASQGIGRACALELARQGAVVALAARNLEKLAGVAAEIAAAGGTAHPFELDVASEESIKAGAKAVIERFGKVEILVNNAGITRDILALRMKRKDWDDVLSTNLTGAFLLTQAVMSSMVKNRWGRVINITSVVGETGQAGQANYAASKAGLIGSDEVAGSGAGRAVDYGERGGSGVHRDGYDCDPDGRPEDGDDAAYSAGAGWDGHGYCSCRRVSGV